jgi:hypothetical protein
MEFKEIQKIIKSFEASSLQILELEQDGFKLKLSKATPTQNTVQREQPVECYKRQHHHYFAFGWNILFRRRT